MSTIDALGNSHRGAGAPTGGQFVSKTNTAPLSGLAGGDEWRATIRRDAGRLGADAAFAHDAIDLDNGIPRDIYDLFEEVTGRDYDSDNRADGANDELDILVIAGAYEDAFASAKVTKPAPGDADDLLARYRRVFTEYQSAQADGGGEGADYERYEDSMMELVGELAATLDQYRAAEKNAADAPAGGGPRATPEQIAAVQAHVDATWSPEATLYEPVDGHPGEFVDIIAFDGGEGSAKKFTIDPTGEITDYDIEKDPNA